MAYFKLIALAALVSVCFGCEHPPSKWCESPVIARDCGVEIQCQRWMTNDLKMSGENDVHYMEPIQPVEIGLYYETYCPACRELIKDTIYPVYQKLSSIFTVDLVPYGNAQEKEVRGKHVFTCQHGEKECYGNLIHTCALNKYSLNETFPFIACMEASKKLPKVAATECAKAHKLDVNKIMDCVEGDEGNKLEHQMAVKTESLVPKHEYVPWITLNGIHTEEIQDKVFSDFAGLICSTYKGPKPEECKKKFKKCNRN